MIVRVAMKIGVTTGDLCLGAICLEIGFVTFVNEKAPNDTVVYENHVVLVHFHCVCAITKLKENRFETSMQVRTKKR